jgi:hypothetical protein
MKLFIVIILILTGCGGNKEKELSKIAERIENNIDKIEKNIDKNINQKKILICKTLRRHMIVSPTTQSSISGLPSSVSDDDIILVCEPLDELNNSNDSDFNTSGDENSEN